jgi:predicted MPP superfamily phosphohydrolase
MRVFFYAIVVQLILNGYVFWWFWRALSNLKIVRAVIAIAFIAELIVYLLGFFFLRHFPDEIRQAIVLTGTSWMVLILYLSALLLIYDAIRYINKEKRFLPKRFDLTSVKIRAIYFLTSFVLILSMMFYGNYRFKHPVITELDLKVEKESPNIKNLKIVLASDLHVGLLIDRDMLRMYVDKIMEQQPDIILMAGDIIDFDLASVKRQNMEEEFHRLKAPYGVYASTGNHEYIKLEDEVDEEKITWLSEKAGLSVLRDSVVMINDSFYLVGREDDKKKDRKPLQQIIKNIDKDYPVIVINHEPHKLKEESEAGVDIALYGHTHNGQLFPYPIMLKAIYEVVYGYKKKDNTHMYVSSGLGLAGPQYRIGTVSEIVVLNVTFAKD